MKLLQNPWVVGGLAAAALAVVGYVMVLPRLHLGRRPAPQPSASLPATSAPTGAGSVLAPPPKIVPPPAMAIERAYAQQHFASWVTAPQRDPFLILGTAPSPGLFKPPVEISPVATMKLKGIWRQTGGSFAAIDKGLYREGEQILAGYKLERIEGDQVWIQGPERREALDFGQRFVPPPPPPHTNIIDQLLGPEPKDPLHPKL